MSDSPTTHSINFAPADWRLQPAVDPRRSLLLTAALATLLTVTALSFSVAPPLPAEALQPQQPVQSTATEVRVETTDPAAIALWRAREYLPWQQFLADLPDYMGSDTSVQSVKYNSTSRTLNIAGHIRGVGQLPDVMLRLEELSWLSEPNLLEVELDDKTRHTRFTLQLRVTPLLPLQEDR